MAAANGELVELPDEMLLLLPQPAHQEPDWWQENKLSCLFTHAEDAVAVAVKAVDRESGLLVVRCPYPAEPFRGTQGTVTVTGVDSREPSTEKLLYVPSGDSNSQFVFASKSETSGLYVFVKGLTHRMGELLDVSNMRCIFGATLTTEVLSGGQEVLHCQHPPEPFRQYFWNRKVSIEMLDSEVLHSVAYYQSEGIKVDARSTDLSAPELLAQGKMSPVPKEHFLCSCTMVRNRAKFLREWVTYHTELGVERVFLYDNNSDDDTPAIVGSLTNANVTRHLWPWVKSQQAGFAHCALRSRDICMWTMFIDVDEFVYPKHNIQHQQEPSPGGQGRQSVTPVLHEMINDVAGSASKLPVGQMQLDCLDFGPSGRTEHPAEGVTVGYTCRLARPERYKSVVLTDAIDNSMLNVVHRFELQQRFRTVKVEHRRAVIHHYKYQVWAEFKAKFERRVATGVADWTEERSLGSKDRAPGLGTEAVEPKDWAEQFCEVVDTSLQEYVLKNFRDSSNETLLWQR